MDDYECAREYFKEIGTKSIIDTAYNMPLPKAKPGYEYVPIPNNGGFTIILHF